MTGSATLHLHLLPPALGAGEHVHAAALRVDGDPTPLAAIPETDRLWYAIPEALAGDVTDSADPFLVGLNFRAMGRGLPLHVHGQVSPTLLAGLEEFMEIFGAWHPRRLRPIAITADDEREPDPPAEPRRGLMGFTGGLDSCHTAWRHKTGRVGHRQVDLAAGLFAGGIDLPLEKARDWQLACRDTERILASVDMSMIPMRTNARRLGQSKYESSGAMVIACLLLFQRRYGKALVASGCDYARFVTPEPTSPLTDGLLSTGACRVVHDGAERSRPAKCREIADWPAALADLRVCYRRIQDGRNCGRCEKCMRTVLDFRVAGLPPPASFPHDVRDEDIANFRLTDFTGSWSFETLVLEAEAAGLGAQSWVRAVRRALAAQRRRQRLKSLRRGLRRVRARVGLYNPDRA